jgi:hypothetical protein
MSGPPNLNGFGVIARIFDTFVEDVYFYYVFVSLEIAP